MGISDDMHKDFLKAMREPSFTEGEWYSEDGFIFSNNGNKNIMIADFVPSFDDARLMAQSKKMYELLKSVVIDQDKWYYDICAILSEIDQ